MSAALAACVRGHKTSTPPAKYRDKNTASRLQMQDLTSSTTNPVLGVQGFRVGLYGVL